MKAQDILDSLQGTQTNDPRMIQAATLLADYTREFQAGRMSSEEYQELVADLQVENLIYAQCDDLAAKERLNSICSAVLSAASLLSSI
jgi:hypothetical protein